MSSRFEIRMPEDNQEGTTSVLGKWMKKVGDIVALHEPVAEINTDKVTVEIPSPVAGVLSEILKHEGEAVAPGEVVGLIASGDIAASVVPADKDSIKQQQGTPQDARVSGSSTVLSPAVKALLKQHNLDASDVTGTGRDGRITADDVVKAAAGKSASGRSAGRKVPHTPMRRAIAQHMVESMLKTAPHVSCLFEADMSAVVAHREREKDAFAAKGVKLTYTAYFVQAVVAALRAVPEVNSRFHADALEIFDSYNIGIAAALGKDGLVVPVLRDAQKFDLLEIARVLQDFTEKARSNALTQQDMQGGTFTITNHGVSGSLLATPIINQPQSAIMGIGKMEKRVFVGENDELKIRPAVYVTLTIDHRALDGFTANSFLSAFVGALESWS